MKSVIARQTQFPVGQGGLHLCRVWVADDDRMPPFSMVFDCGGQGSALALERGILRLRRGLALQDEDRVLNLLVLSHLHADHINGFKRLTSGPRLRIDRLLLPHYDEQAIALLLAQTAAETGSADALLEMANITADIPGWFGERGVGQVISIEPDDEPEAPPFPVFSLDGPPDGFQPIKGAMPPKGDSRGEGETLNIWSAVPANIEEISLGAANHLHLSSRTILTLNSSSSGKQCWVFLPYARKQVPSGGHGDRTLLKQDVDRVLAPYRKSGHLVFPHASGQQVIHDLVKAYRAYTSANKWNDISLTLASGVPQGWCDRVYQFEDRPWWSLGPLTESASWFWVHSGDAVLAGMDGHAWRTRFQNYLHQLSLFQAPHHGSRHNLDESTIAALPSTLLSFATARDGDVKHPHPDITRILNTHGVELWTVSEDMASELATWVEVIFR